MGIVEIGPTTILQAVNFIILFIVMQKMFFPYLMEEMKKREEMIKKDLDEAESVNAEALSLKEEYEAKLKGARQEATQIIQQASSEGERIKNELIAESKTEAHHITQRARTEIEQEKRKVMEELKNQVAALASAMAAKVLRESLDQESQQKIMEQILKKVGERSAS